MTQTYITVLGIVHTYLRSKMDIKPKCKCGQFLRKLTYNSPNKRIRIGFMCFSCNFILVKNKFTVLKYRDDNLK